MSSFSLQGRKALITGSSQGIGRAIALAFVQAGAEVIAHDIAPSRTADETMRCIEQAGGQALLLTGDLSLPHGGRLLAEQALAARGGIDILVANASVQIRRAWNEIPVEEAERQWRVNFQSSLEMMQVLAPAMEERKWGRFLAIGSIQQVMPHPAMAVYAATKAAQANLVLSLARQLARAGITANVLAPGVILTPRNEQILSDAAYAEQARERIPAGSFGLPEDCAGAALLLCSDAGRYITGQTLYIDGGMSL